VGGVAQFGSIGIGPGSLWKERDGLSKGHGVHQKPSFMKGKLVPVLYELIKHQAMKTYVGVEV
jgi:hypothetical protein